MQIDFAYKHPKTIEFEEKFLELVNTHVPFFALSESLIKLMEARKKPYFDIPANKSTNGKWLRFHFEIEDHKQYKLYYYEKLEIFDKKP